MKCRFARSVSGLAVALAALAAPAAALPPRPADLTVVGGDGWRADRSFSLAWAAPVASSPALAATRYRIRDPSGRTIAAGVVARTEDGIGPLVVPPAPGSYGTEVWFEDAAGGQGPAATALLRFDDTPPAPVEPAPAPEWVGRATIPLRIRLTHPGGPQPLAGIRGYAVAIDGEPAGTPCAAPDRCAAAETTLRGGVDDDVVEIAALPEGTDYLHVVAVSGSGIKSSVAGHTALHVDTADPDTRIYGVPAGWTNRSVVLTAGATDTGSGMEADGRGATPFTAIRVDERAPAIGRGRFARAQVIEEGAHRIAYYARDAAGNVNDGRERNGVEGHAPGTAWVRIDRTPPHVAFTNSQSAADPDLLRVRIVDPLSGPDPTRGWIGVRRAGSGDRFEPLPSAPPGESELRARWSSDAQPLGRYEFRAVGYDAAGNATVATQRRDGASMILANPLKATTTLRARFHRHGARRTVPYGRRILLRGRLTTGIDSPLGGAPVRIVERFAAGADPATRVTKVETGPRGGFSLRLARGPSRTIAIGFGGSPTLARAAARPLHLRVRSRVRLRASAAVARVGGAPLVLRGRLIAPRGAMRRGGKSVQLQFRLPGQPWSEFRTVATDRRGRFRLAYRFSDDDSRGARFQFRAYAPAQENWPFEPAGSRPVLVRGI